MDVALETVDAEPRLLLRLEAAVHVGLGVRPLDEERHQRGHNRAEDQEHGEHLDERVAALAAEPAHRDLFWTNASAASARALLFSPMPQTCWARAFAAIRTRSASAPCHQPNRAPVTTHEFW